MHSVRTRERNARFLHVAPVFAHFPKYSECMLLQIAEQRGRVSLKSTQSEFVKNTAGNTTKPMFPSQGPLNKSETPHLFSTCNATRGQQKRPSEEMQCLLLLFCGLCRWQARKTGTKKSRDSGLVCNYACMSCACTKTNSSTAGTKSAMEHLLRTSICKKARTAC